MVKLTESVMNSCNKNKIKTVVLLTSTGTTNPPSGEPEFKRFPSLFCCWCFWVGGGIAFPLALVNHSFLFDSSGKMSTSPTPICKGPKRSLPLVPKLWLRGKPLRSFIFLFFYFIFFYLFSFFSLGDLSFFSLFQLGEKYNIRVAVICPSAVLGPRLSGADPSDFVVRILTGERKWEKTPNGSMSFVDVRDLAALHVAALENENAKGRFFGVCENSAHFEDVAKMLKENYPSLEIPPPLEDERVRGKRKKKTNK